MQPDAASSTASRHVEGQIYAVQQHGTEGISLRPVATGMCNTRTHPGRIRHATKLLNQAHDASWRQQLVPAGCDPACYESSLMTNNTVTLADSSHPVDAWGAAVQVTTRTLLQAARQATQHRKQLMHHICKTCTDQ